MCSRLQNIKLLPLSCVFMSILVASARLDIEMILSPRLSSPMLLSLYYHPHVSPVCCYSYTHRLTASRQFSDRREVVFNDAVP